MQTGKTIEVTQENLHLFKGGLYKICQHSSKLIDNMASYPLEISIGSVYRVVLQRPVELIELMLNLNLKIMEHENEGAT